VEAAKLLTEAMHEDTMQDRRIVDEEWVRASTPVLLSHDCTEKNEGAGGKHGVDFTKFFLKLRPDADETIFEDDDQT
jgi:hypothetical protein